MFGDSDEGTRKGVEKAERCLSVSIVQRLRFWIVKVNHHFLSGIDKDVIALSSVAKLALGIFWWIVVRGTVSGRGLEDSVETLTERGIAKPVAMIASVRDKKFFLEAS